MQLTKKHREDFVAAVMADVPVEDTKTKADDWVRKQIVQLRKEAKVEFIDRERLTYASMCLHVFRIIDGGNPTEYVVTRPNYNTIQETLTFISHGDYGVTSVELKQLGESAHLLKLQDQYVKELNDRLKLSKQLQAVIGACRTIKQAQEALPEFAKYLPAPTIPQSRMLPAVGNLVAELNKAGWPAKKKGNTYENRMR